MANSDFLTIDEIAAYLKTKKSCIYSWTHLKQIPHIKIGKKLYFDRNTIDQWVQSKAVKTNAELDAKAAQILISRG